MFENRTIPFERINWPLDSIFTTDYTIYMSLHDDCCNKEIYHNYINRTNGTTCVQHVLQYTSGYWNYFWGRNSTFGNIINQQ